MKKFISIKVILIVLTILSISGNLLAQNKIEKSNITFKKLEKKQSTQKHNLKPQKEVDKPNLKKDNSSFRRIKMPVNDITTLKKDNSTNKSPSKVKQFNAQPLKAKPNPLNTNIKTKKLYKSEFSKSEYGKLKSTEAKDRVKRKILKYASSVVSVSNDLAVYSEKIKQAKAKVQTEIEKGIINAEQAEAKITKIKQAELALEKLRQHINSEKATLKAFDR